MRRLSAFLSMICNGQGLTSASRLDRIDVRFSSQPPLAARIFFIGAVFLSVRQ